jgi:hypothetical protein
MAVRAAAVGDPEHHLAGGHFPGDANDAARQWARVADGVADEL